MEESQSKCVSHIRLLMEPLCLHLLMHGLVGRGESLNLYISLLMQHHISHQRDLLGFTQTGVIMKEKIAIGRFVFGKSAIAALKEAASTTFNSQVKFPTLVEAISTFIWSRFIAMS